MEPNNALKIACDELGWSRRKLAEVAQITNTQAWRLLTGRAKPSFETDQRFRRSVPGYAALVDDASSA